MPVSKEISAYMSKLATEGNKQRSKETYINAARKAWVTRRAKKAAKAKELKEAADKRES